MWMEWQEGFAEVLVLDQDQDSFTSSKMVTCKFLPISTQTGSVVEILPEYSKAIVMGKDELLFSFNLKVNLIIFRSFVTE